MGKKYTADSFVKIGGLSYEVLMADGTTSTIKTLNGVSLLGSGNIQQAVAPAPYLEILVPDSTLPSTTTNFTLKGSFFTPSMTVAIVGQTINYITFKSDNLVLVNVTTGATEGSYAVTLNNGIEKVFPNALLIVLGTVFAPTLVDWTNISSNINLETNGTAKTVVLNSTGNAVWDRVINNTKNYSIRINFEATPFGAFDQGFGNGFYFIELRNVSDNAFRYGLAFVYNGDLGIQANSSTVNNNLQSVATGLTMVDKFNDLALRNYELRKIGTTMYYYVNNILIYTYPNSITQDLNIKVNVRNYDLKNIKYIELAS